MQIHLAPPPAGAAQVLVKGMQGVLSGGAVSRLGPADADGLAGRAFGPVPVYRLSSAQVGERLLPDETKIHAWRYVILLGDGEVAGCATIGVSSSTGDLAFSSFQETVHVDEFLEAITRAEQLARERSSDANVGILECRPLRFEAVWVNFREEDLFIPLGQAAPNGGRKALMEIGAAEILTLLQTRLAAGSGVLPLATDP